MVNIPSIKSLQSELDTLVSEARRVQQNLQLNEGRLLEARDELRGLDDPHADQATAHALEAHAHLCNANYGSLHDFVNRLLSLKNVIAS